ncbi:MAG: metallophosphoesterase [Prolixibacteraceae bacterium]
MTNSNIFLAFFLLVSILVASNQGNCQTAPELQQLYFISDCQQPLKLEELHLKPYRNMEARDSLFSDIIRQEPKNLFLLGDLTAAGSSSKKWNAVDYLLDILHDRHTYIHAIPGNHEYMMNARHGMRNYQTRFPADLLYGYCVTVDSIAILMLNSNFSKLGSAGIKKQQLWYNSTMDSLNLAEGIKMILVCTHHSPFTNSKIVKPSELVIEKFLPKFYKSPKSILFISGHSHNLEFFGDRFKKHFLVIGGGGGLKQPLRSSDKKLFADLIQQPNKPTYFYLVAERKGNTLHLYARGLQKDFQRMITFEIAQIQ